MAEDHGKPGSAGGEVGTYLRSRGRSGRRPVTRVVPAGELTGDVTTHSQSAWDTSRVRALYGKLACRDFTRCWPTCRESFPTCRLLDNFWLADHSLENRSDATRKLATMG